MVTPTSPSPRTPRPAAVAGPITKVAAPVLISVFLAGLGALVAYAVTLSTVVAVVCAVVGLVAGAWLGAWLVRRGMVGTPRYQWQDDLADAGVDSYDAACDVRGSWYPADGGQPQPFEGTLVLSAGSLSVLDSRGMVTPLCGPDATVEYSSGARPVGVGTVVLVLLELLVSFASPGGIFLAGGSERASVVAVPTNGGWCALWVTDAYVPKAIARRAQRVTGTARRDQLGAAAVTAWPQYRWHRDRVRAAG